MMHASRLARLAYGALAENVHQIQLETIQQEAVNKRFGEDALPVTDIVRRMGRNLLLDPSYRDIGDERMGRMREYLATMRELEALFEIEEKENMEAFARAFKASMSAGE